MADVLVKPAFVSPYLDGPDATKLQPSQWNAARVFTGGVEGEILVRRAASATGAAWEAPAAPSADAGTLTGATLAANVLASSLTSVGTLAALTVTAPIAGSVTGASGSTTGNAATATLAASATVLATPRAINGVNFDGSAPITVAAAAGTLTGATLAAGVTASSLTSLGTITSLSATKVLAGDGTAGAPAYSFGSETTLGFWRASNTVVQFQGTQLSMQTGATVAVSQAGIRNAISGGRIAPGGGAGLWALTNDAQTIGSLIKADALPTIASGFGAGAAVTAGSTPLAGSVNTGAASASGVIAFNGTVFPSAPFPVCMNQTTGLAVKATATTSQLTITPATGNFGANDVISWHCISSK